jgi:lysozyme
LNKYTISASGKTRGNERITMIGGFLATMLALLIPAAAVAQQSAEAWQIVRSQSQIETFGGSLSIAPSSTGRQLNRVSLELIKAFEGWVPTAYNDPAGYCTIGYGHLIDLKRCDVANLEGFTGQLTETAGEALLTKDVTSARVAVQRLVTVALTDDQFGALVSFVFNIGENNFQRSTLLRILNTGDYRNAVTELRRWISAGGRVIDGLVQRRGCEAALFQGALAVNPQGGLNLSACRSLPAAPSVRLPIDILVGE